MQQCQLGKHRVGWLCPYLVLNDHLGHFWFRVPLYEEKTKAGPPTVSAMGSLLPGVMVKSGLDFHFSNYNLAIRTTVHKIEPIIRMYIWMHHLPEET